MARSTGSASRRVRASHHPRAPRLTSSVSSLARAAGTGEQQNDRERGASNPACRDSTSHVMHSIVLSSRSPLQECCMSREQSPGSDALPPHAQLIQMGTGSWSRDRLCGGQTGPRRSPGRRTEERRRTRRRDAARTHRRCIGLMRTLASLGILTERERPAVRADAARRGARDRRARIGASHAAGVLQPVVRARLGGDSLLAANRQDRLREGGRHADLRIPGRNTRRTRPILSEAMVGFHGAEPPAVAAAYDFSGFKTVVDVGGATGNMLAAILSRHAGPRGAVRSPARGRRRACC